MGTMKLLIPFAFSGLILAAPVPNVFESEGLDGECEQDIVNAAPAFVDQPSLLLDLNIDTETEDSTCEYDETTAEPVKTEPPVVVTDPPNNLAVETDPPEASGACEREEDDDDADIIGDDEIERDNEEVFDNIEEYAKRAILDQDIKLNFEVNNLENGEECVEEEY